MESGERIQGANCTELLQTRRMAEGPFSSQTLTRVYALFSSASSDFLLSKMCHHTGHIGKSSLVQTG